MILSARYVRFLSYSAIVSLSRVTGWTPSYWGHRNPRLRILVRRAPSNPALKRCKVSQISSPLRLRQRLLRAMRLPSSLLHRRLTRPLPVRSLLSKGIKMMQRGSGSDGPRMSLNQNAIGLTYYEQIFATGYPFCAPRFAGVLVVDSLWLVYTCKWSILSV